MIGSFRSFCFFLLELDGGGLKNVLKRNLMITVHAFYSMFLYFVFYLLSSRETHSQGTSRGKNKYDPGNEVAVYAKKK